MGINGFGQFNKFQDMVNSTYYFVGETKREELLYLALAMCAEAGEAGDEIKKMMRDDDGILTEERKEKIKTEMGDTLFYMAILASKLGFDFYDAANAEISKLTDMIAKWEKENDTTFNIETFKQIKANKTN
ncbi:MAG: hypothetical protein M0R51_01370 [Clostridia bacterium]|nr:hypothetical protein [Clostridia bacterium]